SQKERGSAVMHIEWQIYSVADAKVIARVPTDGGAQVGFMNGLLEQLLQQSFAENVRQMAASPEFRRVVLSGASAEAPPATAPIRVAYRKPAAPVPLKEDAQGVVLIRVGDGFGSGVLISPDGYILTNHHVAGASGHVRVRWADGSETVAEVVRSDRARDVALLKVDAVKGAPLPIRATPVELGETVYAIGTPVEHVLQNTVTRGIVSGMRLIEGHSYIQSDVPVSHGNSGGPLVDEKGAVVGLTDRGMDPSAGTLLNFFIPIGDALKALDVKPAG
ncbi:MAG: hypothetical protein JWQ97_909, partial [Phenylobacterium sp.]|nr:hypothetical protein [Phenylobacterium sp.]